MKKILKKEVIIAFIIGLLIASSIAVYAATINAKDVDYKNGKTVEYALNELYGKQAQVVAQGEKVSSGTTITVDIGSFVVGTSFGNMGATNTETIVEHLWGDTYAGIGSRTSVYKANGTSVTLTCDRECSYIVIK